jgi:hypothetical protein
MDFLQETGKESEILRRKAFGNPVFATYSSCILQIQAVSENPRFCGFYLCRNPGFL